MQRVGGDGITRNIHAGGLPRANDVDVTELATKAAKSVRGRLVGVDIIPDVNGQLWVLEANATPGWSGLQQVTNFDLSKKIADTFCRR
jgi:glutathione synthase/RimK-type ligase-like ATP-grasp enzyme